MESFKYKPLVLIITLAAILVVSLAVSALIAARNNRGVAALEGWTPPPTATSTLTPTPSPRPSLVPSATATVTPTLDPTRDCIHTPLYWMDHLETWPARVMVADFSYTKEQVAALALQPGQLEGDLLVQLNAAFLNATNGAQYHAVYDTILAAASWLKNHPSGGSTSSSDQQAGLSLVATLTDYNEGRLGPRLCAVDLTPVAAYPISPTTTAPTLIILETALVNTPTTASLSTPRPTYTPTAAPGGGPGPIPSSATPTRVTPSPRPTILITSTPTATPTRTLTPTFTRTPTQMPPTATNTATRAPTATNTPLPTATNTPVPTATHTPAPPTDTPRPPTNTPAAPPTDTPRPPTDTPEPSPLVPHSPVPYGVIEIAERPNTFRR